MAIVPVKKLGPFLGENNRLPRHALNVSTRALSGDYLASSKNVDIDNTGRLARANGTTLHAALTAGHSLFSDGLRTLFAESSTLRRITAFAPFAAVDVDTVAGAVAYAVENGEIFYSDGAKLRCLEEANTVRAVGIPVPASLSGVVIAGTLQPAKYQATITYMVGVEEGGAFPSINLELSAAGGIRLSLPATPAGVTAIRVYLSGPDGEVPTRHSTVSASASTVDLTTPASGMTCRTALKGPMPAGDHLAFCLGRLLVAAGQVLYYSDQFNYALTNPSKNFIPFPEPITNVVTCKDGVYVTAGKTWWIANFADPLGDPILPYGAVAKTAFAIPNENKVGWLSVRGLVIGDSGGQVKNVQEDNLLLSLSGSGASVFIEGNNRIVSSGNG